MSIAKKEFYVVIEKDEDGFYFGEVPQLKACYSQGETIDELMSNMKEVIELIVNGETKEILVRPNDLLVDVLRDEILLTGTKKGCGDGDCGACTVLLDGAPVLACLTLAIACVEKRIETIEGLSLPKRFTCGLRHPS